jgi:branched-chain amino acid transport system substrate-binding protein
MSVTRRGLIGTAALGAAATALPIRRARAQRGKDDVIRLGVLSDMSGTYKDTAGPVAVSCAKLATMDFAQGGKSLKTDVIQADHQNKPDIAAGIARQWYDQGVDVILEVSNSACGLAVAGVAKDKNGVYLNSGAATSDLTGSQCNPNTIHWTYDTYMLGKSTGGALVKAGGDTWFFVTADYAFGTALQRDTTEFITAAHGKVLGSVRYPFPGTTDFSSFLLQAQASGAKVLGLANAGLDTVNSVKAAHEFGLTGQMRIAALLCFISDVHAIGLDIAQGLTLTTSFYWDHDDRTRAFSKRLEPLAPGVRATMTQAGTYSSGLAYLRLVEAMGVAESKKDGAATVAYMKKMTPDDDVFGKSTIREDGQCVHPSFLWEVKKPSESKGPWDYYKPISTTPPDEAFRPLSESACPLVKKA